MKINREILFLIIPIILISAIFIFSKSNKKVNIINSEICTFSDSEPPNVKNPTKEQVEKYLECRPVSIFIKKDTLEEDIATFEQELKNMGRVYKVEYISTEKAGEIYKEQNKNEQILIDTFKEGTLNASFSVYLSDPKFKNLVIERAKLKPFVSEATN